MKIVRIPTSNLDEVWVLVKKDIANALTYSGDNHNAQFVLDTLRKEEMQLWIIWDKDKPTTKEKYFGVVVTELIKRTLRKVCHVFIVTGNQRQKWIPLIQVLEEFAKENECDGMELIARPGWQKVLQNYKYKRTHVVLEKSINKKDK